MMKVFEPPTVCGWLVVAFCAAALPSACAQANTALQERNHAVLEESLCPAPQGETPFPPAYSDVDDPRIEPMQVFDNLYFFGTRVDSAWLLETDEGLILFDAMFPHEIEETVIDAMPRFGLDPHDIEYVVISHGHADHFGGAALLQERYEARVVMSNTEWHYLRDTQADGEAPLPQRDLTVLDGDTLTLGGTTVRFVATPGHTPGTLSSVFPVHDAGQTHRAALWGGTAMNFIEAEDVRVYQRSLARFRDVDPGIDVVLSNHAYADGAELKMAALREREAGESHPFVVGHQGFQAWLDVIEGCADAWLARKREQ